MVSPGLRSRSIYVPRNGTGTAQGGVSTLSRSRVNFNAIIDTHSRFILGGMPRSVWRCRRSGWVGMARSRLIDRLFYRRCGCYNPSQLASALARGGAEGQGVPGSCSIEYNPPITLGLAAFCVAYHCSSHRLALGLTLPVFSISQGHT